MQSNQKKMRVITILTSDRANFRTRKVTKNKDGNCITSKSVYFKKT